MSFQDKMQSDQKNEYASSGSGFFKFKEGINPTTLESDNLWGIKYEIMNEIYEIIENVVILFLVIECWGFRVKLNRLEKKLK